MKQIIINEDKLWEIIKELKEKRDDYVKSSVEYIEIDNQINLILKIIRDCKI